MDPITPVPIGEERRTPSGARIRLLADGTVEYHYMGVLGWERVTGKTLEYYRTIAAVLAPLLSTDAK